MSPQVGSAVHFWIHCQSSKYYYDIYFHHLTYSTYIKINYYYDKNHANSTVITQYVEIALLNNKSTVLCVFCFYFVLDWSGFQW